MTLPMLERVRKRLRNLIKFIERRGGREDVYTDFEDELGEEREITGLIQTDVNLKNYRLKVERFIRDHQSHIAIRRIRQNQPIQAGDIDSLEAMLFGDDGPGSREEFEANYRVHFRNRLCEYSRPDVLPDDPPATSARASVVGSSTFP